MLVRPHRKQTNQAVDVSLGTNVEQSMLFQMASRKIAIAPENLEIFPVSKFQEECDF